MLLRHLPIFFITLFCVFQSVENLGSFKDQNPADYRDKAWKAVSAINNGVENKLMFQYIVPIKVIKARTRVTTGTETELEVLVGESTCTKAIKVSEVAAAKCPIMKGASRAIYKVSILEKKNTEEVTVQRVRGVDSSENF